MVQLGVPPDASTVEACGSRARVLIHGINYAPEPTGVGRYTADLAEFLAASGYCVEVVTAVPHYPGWWVRPPFKWYRYSAEVRNRVKVIRCPLLVRRACRNLWRLVTPLSFAVAAAPVVVWRVLRTRPGTIVCIEPTLLSAPCALLAGRLVGAKCVLHVHDIEVDAAFAVGHLRNTLAKRIAQALDGIISGRFDAILTLSESMKQRLGARIGHRVPISVIRNWVDTDKIKPMEGRNSFRTELGLTASDFVALYAGQIGEKQALHFVFDVAEALARNPDLHFVVAGEGPLKERFVQRYGKCPNIHFLPAQPEEKLCELLNVADVHILPQPSSTADLVLPSKLGGMLATEKRILAIVDAGTELHSLLKDVAILVRPGDKAALVEGILGARKHELDLVRMRDLKELFRRDLNLPALSAAIFAT
jgi:putative colanic acid biosynthesis glycosyltransferase WcaI